MIAMFLIGLVTGIVLALWWVKKGLYMRIGWRGNPRNIPPAIRRWVERTSSYTCIYCGRKGDDKDPDGHPWEIDHVIPLSAGGSHSVSNFALSCRACNRSKSDNMPPMPVVSLKPRRMTDE